MKQHREETVHLDKLVHGGQALSRLPDGRAVFVWGGLPGEMVAIMLTKQKKDYCEAVVRQVLEPSKERIEPRDAAYLSTSPWQIMSSEAEDNYKKAILEETFQRSDAHGLQKISFSPAKTFWQYRNKMEYSFFGDETGLHLALYQRGTRCKQILTGSSIAMPSIDKTAEAIRQLLEKNNVRASDLKAVIVRSNQVGDTAAALFVKREDFPDIKQLSGTCQGVVVYYSTSKSPASVATKQLYRYGDSVLQDEISRHPINYDVTSFFQVNVPELEPVIERMSSHLSGSDEVIDFYAGVGTFARVLNATKMVELDEANIKLARRNVSKACAIIHASAENSLEHIPSGSTTVLIVDPPRAGLHKKVIQQILAQRPARITYLSCNPVTQARDIALLQGLYGLVELSGHNFFPRTPHIESLALLELKA